MATFATCCTGTGAELLNRDKGGIMAVDTQWATREEVAQDRERVQALTDAQAQDRERISLLEVRVGEQLATKEDVEKAIGSVKVDLASVKTSLRWIIGIMSVVGTAAIALVADLVFRWLG